VDQSIAVLVDQVDVVEDRPGELDVRRHAVVQRLCVSGYFYSNRFSWPRSWLADAAGTVDVQGTNPAGTSATSSADQYTYVAAAPPSVIGVSPNTGPKVGGNVVTIMGSGFTGASQVYFGSVAATDFTVHNDGSIFATAPAEAEGIVDINVTTPSGTSATGSADMYTYYGPAVTGVSPKSGSTAGGRQVTIWGSGFTGATAVWFGWVEVTTFTILNDGEIVVYSPAESPGTMNIVVDTPYGASMTSSADQYTYS
jgi:hypothetical protein